MGHGWSQYSLSEDLATRRWQTLRQYHSQKWYDFLRDTLLGHRYLLIMEQMELARKLIEAMVTSTLELVSPLKFKIPGWVNAPECPNES
jgi:hypothetical protein